MQERETHARTHTHTHTHTNTPTRTDVMAVVENISSDLETVAMKKSCCSWSEEAVEDAEELKCNVGAV